MRAGVHQQVRILVYVYSSAYCPDLGQHKCKYTFHRAIRARCASRRPIVSMRASRFLALASRLGISNSKYIPCIGNHGDSCTTAKVPRYRRMRYSIYIGFRLISASCRSLSFSLVACRWLSLSSRTYYHCTFDFKNVEHRVLACK
jgi:hypothetical protein